MGAVVNNGLLNDFTIRPKNLTQYTAFRGVTDFTRLGQFDQFETGYSFLSVLQIPTFMRKLADFDSRYKELVNSFVHMLEFEFRGLDGLEDIQGETFELTDGINPMNLINKVTQNTAITVSMNYWERRGGLIAKFTESYLTGIKDKMTQAKTYHGLIKNNILEPSFQNEVFTMMYYVTDSTMLRLEKAVLLCNMQLQKSEQSQYNSQRGEIANKEITIEMSAFPVTGFEVDRAAKMLLQDITGVAVNFTDNNNGRPTYSTDNTVKNPAVLDSTDYLYGIMDANVADSAVDRLTDAISRGKN